MRTFHSSVVCLSLSLGVALLPAAASAQKAAPAKDVPLSDALHGSAKDAYTSARLLFNNGDYAGALTKYGAAYDAAKDPRLLYNMALCEKNLRQYAKMQEFLLRYQRDSAGTISKEHKAVLDEALSAIRNLVGSVTVTASVPEATVTVDGEKVGVTPLADSLSLDLGKHKIVITMTGFVPFTKEVEISGNDQQTVDAKLAALAPEKPHGGHLLVTAEPGSTIFVDGTAVGTDRVDEPIAAGSHEVRVTASGKVPYASDVDIHDGESRTVEVTLSDEVHGAPVWPWIVGGVALAAGAAVGGYFLFKPSDHTTPIPEARDGNIQFGAWGTR